MLNQEGGKVIASGGFGCIFKPALKCDNSEMRETNKISKLMTIKHATEEYKQIQQFNHILQVIPNYERYFLLDNFVLCKPSKLTKDDLNKYNKKCKALKKKDITKKNINKNLDKLMTLNMPYGGINVEEFIQSYFINTNIIRLNNSLIELLVNGIIPMNKLNVYHCDIKDGNILVEISETTLTTRLIDWGISVIYNSNETNKIPRKLYRRPFQYNVPFSSILFNKDFMKLYTKFLTLNQNPNSYQIREFIMNYIFIWNETRGSGHLSAINDIIRELTIKELPSIKNKKVKEHVVEYDFTYYYIIDYLSAILEKFTNNGVFDLMLYFNTVFLKNIDIWGFTMTYIVLYEYLYRSFDSLNEYQMQFVLKIKYIIIHFLFECPVTPINTDLLVNEFKSLNKLIDMFDIPKKSLKLELEIGGKLSRGKTNKNRNIKRNKTMKRKSRKHNK